MTTLLPQDVMSSVQSYRLIYLSRDKFAIVDKANYEWLSRWKWYAKESGNGKFYAVHAIHKYRRGKVVTHVVRMHNVILGVKRGADHKNGNGLDNRRTNLRPATHQQNTCNTKLRSDNKSGYTGVNPCKRTGQWQVHISVDKRRRYLGRFDKFEDAVSARKEGERKHYGEFVRPLHQAGPLAAGGGIAPWGAAPAAPGSSSSGIAWSM